MRWSASLVLAAAACGGQAVQVAPGAPVSPTAAAEVPVPAYEATRWVPAHPTYLLAARRLDDLEQVAASYAPDQATALARQVQDAGLDPEGGAAVFSEDLEPTLVVHLSDAPKAEHLLSSLTGACGQTICSHASGVQRPASSAAEGPRGSISIEGVRVSWAIDHDWLWIHVGSDPAWLAHSQHHAPAAWLGQWHAAAASAGGAGRALGFVDPGALAGALSGRLGAAVACVELARPIEHVGLAFGGGAGRIDARISFDLDHAAADGVRRADVPPPAGWQQAFAGAPLSVQANLDLDALARWIAPCGQAFGVDLAALNIADVRAARLGLVSVQADDPWATRGAIALDLRDRSYFAKLLDQIPLRSHLESSRMFGYMPGHHLRIPFKGALDYVLDDQHGLFAMGDGLLAQVVGGAPAVTGAPLADLELRPAAIAPDAWRSLFDLADADAAAGVLAHLEGWAELHAGLSLDHDELVLDVSGRRK